MKYFFDRLKEERKRLGLNQDEFAALGGVKKGAQFNYENGSRTPDSDYLAAVAAAGVDVLYLLTGEHALSALPADEHELLTGYRKLDIRAKARVLGVVEGIVETPYDSATAGGKPHVKTIIHGEVGQQVHGDIVAPQTINVGSKKK
ncbi:helix-turn-helix domain-containing protein [Janthinobacterium sp. SUN206]|uniref:helix-turn-helix domain-containing protein n=1 Tax=Janthinobacterium sp. SUN206 TaxID=3014787 RepID=UPI0027137CC7|nr:helix-turn-helix transcriptional regulator [Janthinobacterium sp. SUN206]MDO8065645.1 helix-turn-helix transcriptional regulator [Janthinobacterium sp. SUN206]